MLKLLDATDEHTQTSYFTHRVVVPSYMGKKEKKKKKMFKKEQNDILYVTETFRLKLDVELKNWANITRNVTISGKIDGS